MVTLETNFKIQDQGAPGGFGGRGGRGERGGRGGRGGDRGGRGGDRGDRGDRGEMRDRPASSRGKWRTTWRIIGWSSSVNGTTLRSALGCPAVWHSIGVRSVDVSYGQYCILWTIMYNSGG